MHNPCLQDCTDGKYAGQGRQTHTIPAYKTAQMAGTPVRGGRHTQSLPTRLHRWQVRRSGEVDTHNPCLQDRTDGRYAGQGRQTHTIPTYKTAQMAGTPVRRGRHTQSLPTRPHRWQVRRSGVTHTHNPCLQDRTDGRYAGQGRQTPTIPAYKTAQMAGAPVRGDRYIQSLPTRPHRWQVRQSGETDTYNPFLQDCTDGRYAGQGRPTHNPCLQDLHRWQVCRSGTGEHKHAYHRHYCNIRW